ncbi:hypothetical protein TSAR_015761 [Trichomalopsis sarcophagae]|uniref:Uncharacterized protein n=1 Tax=Trichomalopsis sarcophagae TaxID=543379 RepID=A0A232EDM9_9HYME|nr:hypothetical protein TSAR_015761 [Trichomalopsis sarcophagae]
MSYGCGAITDGKSKLTVQISNFGNLVIEKGVYVTVTGTLLNKDEFLKVNCEDDSNIVADPIYDPQRLFTNLILHRSILIIINETDIINRKTVLYILLKVLRMKQLLSTC